MSARESLLQLLEVLPEERVRELLAFAQSLGTREESAAWRQFGQTQFAHAYGPDEPDYSTADIKPESKT